MTTISLGTNADLTATAITVASAAATVQRGPEADITVNVGITADGAITINGAGSGTISVSTIGTAGGFTFNGENMGTGSTSLPILLLQHLEIFRLPSVLVGIISLMFPLYKPSVRSQWLVPILRRVM